MYAVWACSFSLLHTYTFLLPPALAAVANNWNSLDYELRSVQVHVWSGSINNLSFGVDWDTLRRVYWLRNVFVVVNKGGSPTQRWDFNQQPSAHRPVCLTSRPSLPPQRAVFLCCLPVSDGTSSRRLRAARGVYLWPAGSAPLSQLPKQSHSTLCWVHQCSADTHTHTCAHTDTHTHREMHTHRCTLQKMSAIKC